MSHSRLYLKYLGQAIALFINDKNVLPFRVDYIKTMEAEPDSDDKEVWDINREKAFLAPERIRLVTEYILDNFDRKTYRGDKTFNVLQNIADVASAGGKQAIEEVKAKQRVSGFNSIFAVSSVGASRLYYTEFMRQMEASPQKRLKITVIYSYDANEEEADDILDEENSEDASTLNSTDRDFLEKEIADYNVISICSCKSIMIRIAITRKSLLRRKAIDASPKLRSKKDLIETFIAGINDVSDVMVEWHSFVAEQRESDLQRIITEEKLKPVVQFLVNVSFEATKDKRERKKTIK